jgi:hypothetical protein
VTFPDDFVRLHLHVGTVNLLCIAIGFKWPPPERFDLNGVEGETMVRVNMSKLTDEERGQMRHVIRGAEYHYETDPATKR